MLSKKFDNSEVKSSDVFIDLPQEAIPENLLPTVQAAKDGPAGPARSVATLALRDNSPVPVKCKVTLREWWLEQFDGVMQLRASLEADDSRLLGGNQQVCLWHLGLAKAAEGNPWWHIRFFVLGHRRQWPKRIWFLDWHSVDQFMPEGRDALSLKENYPEMYDWVRETLVTGRAIPPPPFNSITQQEWHEKRREKRAAIAKEKAEQRRLRAQDKYRKRYAIKKGYRDWRRKELAAKLPPDSHEPILRCIEIMWDEKRPLSLRKQAPLERLAQRVIGQYLGLPEEQVEAWLSLQLAEGRIAYKMVSTKTKMKGLKVL